MCLLCLIYHLASALTMLLCGWQACFVCVHVCVFLIPTGRPKAHEADCLAAKEVRALWFSPTHLADLRRCPGTVGALVCISLLPVDGWVEVEVTSMASCCSPSCPVVLLPLPLSLISSSLTVTLIHNWSVSPNAGLKHLWRGGNSWGSQ